MKIRNGFVSNSSSSSFVIMGVKTTDLDTPEKDYKSKLVFEMCGIDNYRDEHFCGAYPNSMKDNETLREFKQRILDEINQFGFSQTFTMEDLTWWEDAGYNG